MNLSKEVDVESADTASTSGERQGVLRVGSPIVTGTLRAVDNRDLSTVIPGEVYRVTSFGRIRRTVMSLEVVDPLLVCSLSDGVIAVFEMKDMKLLKMHKISDSPIRGIRCGVFPGYCLAIVDNTLTILSLIKVESPKRLEFPYDIRTVLMDSHPFYIICSNGFIYTFHWESSGEISASGPGKQKLDSYQQLFELTHPHAPAAKYCLALKWNVIRVVRIVSPDYACVLREHVILGNNRDVKFKCWYSKYYYAFVEPRAFRETGCVFFGTIDDVGIKREVRSILIKSGSIYNFEVKNSFLFVSTNTKNIEIFSAINETKLYHLTLQNKITRVLLLENSLIMGTNVGNVITKQLPEEDQICYHCRSYFRGIDDDIIRICQHFIPNINF
jgi:hypothetical protein